MPIQERNADARALVNDAVKLARGSGDDAITTRGTLPADNTETGISTGSATQNSTGARFFTLDLSLLNSADVMG